jgi:hypothetical protein
MLNRRCHTTQHPKKQQDAAAQRLWHHVDAASTQRALIQRGLSSLPSINIRAWRGPRLRAGVDGGSVGDNYEKDYLPATRGKEAGPPLVSASGVQGLRFWLPEDRWVVLVVVVGPGEMD